MLFVSTPDNSGAFLSRRLPCAGLHDVKAHGPARYQHVKAMSYRQPFSVIPESVPLIINQAALDFERAS